MVKAFLINPKISFNIYNPLNSGNTILYFVLYIPGTRFNIKI